MANRRTVRIGVFIPTVCQLLDAACVDILGSMSHEYVAQLGFMLPKAVIDLAPSVKIHYIGPVRAGQPIQLTSNQSILATNHYGDEEVAPGKLDIVLVPGPDPSTRFEPEPVEWLRRQGGTDGVDVLSICTGLFLCAEAGLLKGKKGCGPRAMQDMIKAKGYGEQALLGDKLRWVQDGNFWSSAGATNGNDLLAAYCRASQRFPEPLVELVLEALEVGDRAREYGTGMKMMGLIEQVVKTAA